MQVPNILPLTGRSDVNHEVQQRCSEADVERHRRDLGPFVVAAEKTRMPMAFTNALEPGHSIVFANDSFLGLTGLARADILGQPFAAIVAADDAAYMAAFSAEQPVQEDDFEFALRRRDGRVVWVSILVSPVRDDHGRTLQYFVSLLDISRHKEAEVRARLLLGELNHRVKNNLAAIQCIVRNSRGSADIREFRRSMEDRLHTIARVHELLEGTAWHGARLPDICAVALEPILASDALVPERVSLSGSDIVVTANDAFALALAIHELGLNAQRFGALQAGKGSVALTWEVQDGSVRMAWQERGGPPVAPPTHRGMGTYLIDRGLAHALQGEITMGYLPEGLHWRLEFRPTVGRDAG